MALPCLRTGSPLTAGLLALLVAAPQAASASALAPPILKRQGVLAQQVGAIQNAVAASLALAVAPAALSRPAAAATAASGPAAAATARPAAGSVSSATAPTGAAQLPVAAEAALTARLSMAPQAAAAAQSGRLLLVRTERRLPVSGDPVWELQLDLPGQPRRSYEAVVGRASRQLADRQRLGSHAPLPQGRYRLSPATPIQPGDSGELGQFVWIGLEPEFATERRGLGIHHDPSAGWGRESGTDGCIGLIHGNDLLGLAALLERSGTRELLVRD